ncbi:type VI secretion protein IcmF/TssM N-terminal domain-containing protein [Desulfobacula sp.]|uniref:type VI secretion protein IcmF/TssM N-terminal domain-containing protein n=1 Tax=Desulfobacula sp. TaxID=2593537 RepID=UPI00262ADD59|nr:type VI secretion protein IcmF/TssM N-terminal domain-containing protein [Desulfobacula sp.]
MEIKGWPWWISIVLVASCAGILFGYFAIKKLLIRRNEKKFVQKVINEEEAFPREDTDNTQYNQKEAENQWKDSIAKLKKSHLRKFGNPLYVLPWFVLMGESRSGKTSAIKNSNLDSALTDVSQATIISGTKNCDWWFLEQAIVLDTAGRYTIPIEEDKDKKEWGLFLTLLSKYRKKEPINGVIVTVASDALLNEDDTQLSDKAKCIRQRINQMMRVLGAKFPVYLLVTKMDLVNGFTDFCDHIPDQRGTQVMGYANPIDQTDGMKVLEKCMTTIFRQIRNLRSIFIHNRINNFAIAFSNEFMNLKPGLESYVQSLFGDDIYQATPLFRGIYFSSACRKGEPGSGFLETTGIKYKNDASLDRNKGFFLRSFFSAILPKDRNVFMPLSEFLMWRKKTLSLGIFSFILICFAMSGILAFSYFNNAKALNNLDTGFFKSKPMVSNTTDHILIYDRQRFEIERLETNNDGWILPRLGLNQSLMLEKKLKQAFVNDVGKNLIDPMDDLFFDKIKTINSMTPYGDIVGRAVYAIQRIGILKKSIQDKSYYNKKEYEKSIRTLFPTLDPDISKTVTANYASTYYSYLTWNDDHTDSVRKLGEFQNALSQIAVNSDNFDWLLSHWVCSTSDVEIFSFLKGYQINTSILDSKAHIRGAFTRSGREEIKQFIGMIQKASTEQEVFLQMENDFWEWYAKEFYRAWFDFATVFPSGRNWKTLVDNWTDLGTLMTTGQNPYFLLLEKMAQEFEWFKSQIDLEPSWAKTVVTLKEIKYLAETEVKKEKGSFLAKLSLTKEKITEKFEKSSKKIYEQTGKKDVADLEYKMRFSKVWNKYLNSLSTISSATSYNEKCFHMFADFFKALSDPSKQEAPFNLTYDNLLKLNAFLMQNETSPIVYDLIKGPFDFLTTYGIHHSMDYLQSKWEEIVLSASYSIDPEKYYSIMFDKSSGIIWQFVNDEASAFVGQNKTGFLSKTAFELKLPFSNQFFKLLNKGEQLTLEQQDEYAVSITTLPISVNNEAMIRPYSNTLFMECADEKTELLNNNFPETKKFAWRPDTCGDVLLQIRFEESTLHKKYKGRLGFAQFLSEFKDGTKVFNVADFPEYRGYLINNNVTDITVSYDINGIKPVLDFLDRRPPVIPDVIFRNYKSKGSKFPLVKKETKAVEPPKVKGPISPAIQFKDRYTIAMETLPMGVNESAQLKPVAGIMWMKCNEKVIRFENNNYPESITFDWEPENCGKVLIIIQFPEISLLKEYQNFYEFVKDFKYQSRTFFNDEFPEQKEALLKKGISSVTLSYVFKGELPLLEEMRAEKVKEPQKKTKKEIKEETWIKPEGNKSEETIPELSNSSSDNVIHSIDWISKQDTGHYTIHIMLGPDKEEIIGFALINGLLGNTAIYQSSLNGQNRYNLILGSFNTFQNAQKALVALSDSASRYSPWIRKFVSINKEIT